MKSHKRNWSFAALGLASWLISLAIFSFPAVQMLEWRVIDLWTSLRYQQGHNTLQGSKSVSVIEIDEGVFEDLQMQWPLDKNVYGDLLDYLDTMGAKAVVFDILFTDNLSDCGKGDELFLAMLGYFPKTVLTFGALIDPDYPFAYTKNLIPERYYFGTMEGSHLVPMFGALLPYSELLNVAPHLATNSLKSMPDGIDRRVPLFVRDGIHLVANMGLKGAMLAEGIRGEQDGWKWKPEKSCMQTSNACIPVDDEARLYPTFSDSIPEYRLSDVRRAQADWMSGKMPSLGREQFRDKVVFVGASAPSLGDLGSTPISGLARMIHTPNVLMHARVADAILSGKALRPWHRGEVVVLSFLLLLAISILLVFLPVRAGILACTALLVVLPFIAWFALTQNIMWPILEGMNGLVLFFAGTLWIAFRQRDADHNFLNKTFSAYLSPEVIDDMAKNHELPQLGGVEVEGTALFTDIQGFSSFAEILSPDQLVSLLNEYFECMTRVLLEHGATVDKFIGDAIVAFWGAPRATPKHADQAIRAGMAMHQALEDLRQAWVLRGDVPVCIQQMRMRMGINSGRFVVGNMGCSTRMHYTMMGDDVNLAARLESICGKYGIEFLIGENTHHLLTMEHVRSRQLDRITVKGRHTALDVYQVDWTKGKEPNPDWKQYEQIFAIYLQGKFAEAAQLFDELASRDSASALMALRCRYLLGQDEVSWKGVWVWGEK